MSATYSELGVPVVHVADQDSTDLDKCLEYILQLSADQVSTVITCYIQ